MRYQPQTLLLASAMSAACVASATGNVTVIDRLSTIDFDVAATAGPDVDRLQLHHAEELLDTPFEHSIENFRSCR